MSRTPTGLEVTKRLTGDASVDPEVAHAAEVVYEITVTNHGPDDLTDVELYDPTAPFPTTSWVSAVSYGTVAGNTAGPVTTVLDETIDIDAASQIVYTITNDAPQAPWCGTIANAVRVAGAPETKFVEHVASDPIYVGLLQSEAKFCFREQNIQSQMVMDFIGYDLDRNQFVYDWIEQGRTFADLLEWVELIAADADVAIPAPLVVNPNYTG